MFRIEQPCLPHHREQFMSSLSRRHLFGAAAGLAAAGPCRVSLLPRRPLRRRAAATRRGPVRSSCRRCPIRPTRWSRISMPRRWRSTTTGTIRRSSPTSTASPRTIRRSPTSRSEVLGNLAPCRKRSAPAVRNNMGGHANHTMFWQIMGPNGGKPEGEVLAAIDRDLGGMEKFQTDFKPPAAACSARAGCS